MLATSPRKGLPEVVIERRSAVDEAHDSLLLLRLLLPSLISPCLVGLLSPSATAFWMGGQVDCVRGAGVSRHGACAVGWIRAGFPLAAVGF